MKHIMSPFLWAEYDDWDGAEAYFSFLLPARKAWKRWKCRTTRKQKRERREYSRNYQEERRRKQEAWESNRAALEEALAIMPTNWSSVGECASDILDQMRERRRSSDEA